MEVAVIIVVAVFGGMWSLAFKSPDAFGRVSTFARETARPLGYACAGAAFALGITMRGVPAERVAYAIMWTGGACVALLAYLHFLPWVRGDAEGHGPDQSD